MRACISTLTLQADKTSESRPVTYVHTTTATTLRDPVAQSPHRCILTCVADQLPDESHSLGRSPDDRPDAGLRQAHEPGPCRHRRVPQTQAQDHQARRRRWLHPSDTNDRDRGEAHTGPDHCPRRPDRLAIRRVASPARSQHAPGQDHDRWPSHSTHIRPRRRQTCWSRSCALELGWTCRRRWCRRPASVPSPVPWRPGFPRPRWSPSSWIPRCSWRFPPCWLRSSWRLCSSAWILWWSPARLQPSWPKIRSGLL